MLTSAAAAWLTAHAASGQCVSWSAPENVSQISNRFNVDGNVAIDSSGKVHLVYQSFLDASGDNHYIHNVSGSWSSPVNLGSMNGKGSAPKIVITPDDQLHAFYGRNNLYWRTKPVIGGSWSAAVEVAVNPTGGNFIEGITVDAEGGIYLLYGHLFDSSAPARNGIYGRYKPPGGAWQATELVYGNSDDGNWPRGTDIMARGTTLWVGIEVDDNVYFKKKLATGVWPAGKGTLLQTDAGALTFAFSPVSPEMVALYQQDIGCGADPCEQAPWFEVYAKSTFDDGATWSAAVSVSGGQDDIDRTPSGAFDAGGNLHVVWEGFCCDHRLRMRYRGRNNGLWDASITRFTDDVGGHIPHSLQTLGNSLFMSFSNADTNIGLYDVMFTTAVGSQPRISVSTAGLSRTVFSHSSLPDDAIQLANTCPGELNYTLTDNAGWLSVAPASGSSSGETDVITISYPGVSSLAAGIHHAAVTITGNAVNSPQTIQIQLRVQTVRPDFDGDGDVDQTDFGHLQTCLSGPNVAQMEADCFDTRLDADQDVDSDDLGLLLNCYSGANLTANGACAALYP